MKTLNLLTSIALLASLGSCRPGDPAAEAEPVPPPGADVGATGTDATATVIADDSALVRNAHP